MVDSNPTTSIIILNINGLNASLKKEVVRVDKKKRDLTICCIQETHFKYKDLYRLKVNE